LIIVLLLIGGAGVGIWSHRQPVAIQKPINSSPVPLAIAQSVNFPIYYPDPQKLPTGYSLNSSSFKYVPGQGIVYYVNYDNGKRLVFTLQKKPSNDELATFNKKYIPIHREVLTSLGTATIGGISGQTIVSLPTDNLTWIIITGPANIYATDKLTQVVESLKKAG
jgi:hypothetical protein